MELHFKGLLQKEWVLTDTEIIRGSKTYKLEEINSVENKPAKTNTQNGVFIVYMNHGSPLVLAYGYAQEDMARKAEFHIRKVLGETTKVSIMEGKLDHKIIHNGPVSYDETTKDLYIMERGPELSKYVSAREDKNFTTKVTPVKVHVGAASVGGVTTGGVYTTGGDTVVDSSTSSGYWRLEYIHKAGNLFAIKSQAYPVKRIRLTPELFKEAQSSSIAEYTDGKDSIIVVHDVKLTIDDAKTLAERTFSEQAQNIVKRGYPDQRKCQEILAWITGSDF